jgi:signal transduction histidine kinase
MFRIRSDDEVYSTSRNLGVIMGATRIGRLEAVDLGVGKVGRSRNHEIVMKVCAGRHVALQVWLPVALCAALICVEQFHALAFRDPMLRAIIETEITLCALAGAGLFAVSFGHTRQLRNLLLAGALLQLAVIELVSYVVPTSSDLASPGTLTGASMVGTLFMAAAMVVSVSMGRDKKVRPGRKPVLLTIVASVLAAGVAELAGLLLHFRLISSSGVTSRELGAATDHPIGLVLTLLAAAFMTVAAVRTTGSTRAPRDGVTLLLGAAMMTFAGVWLNYVVLPAPGVGWVTAREGLRIVAYGLFFAAALREEAAIRGTIAKTAAAAERRRIARDLHDGLAQDLAFIAAHGDRIAREAGEEHPLAVAARRALAVSRGAIADLSAAEAPTAIAALRQVADELEVRFGVRISVEGDEIELPSDARENVVRIAREAIVNAARAEAGNIIVSLTRSGGSSVLRVLDDGVGIGTERGSRPGFGVKSMRERAVSLGGGVTARAAREGGTELEVVFP